MPSSILINDGRRSASPDRRVTFGNIERYDIMTSNEIKNNMNQKRETGAQPTVTGDYPMTRLDNRIRKALQLGFAPFTGDQVTYDEVLDFLLEFSVIANARVCSERQISAIIQATFPKVITKPSAKYNVIFVNLENKSDDVIKEELVRVTTEPIIDPASREAQAWIKEENEDGLESSDPGDEDEELTQIENKKQMVAAMTAAAAAEKENEHVEVNTYAHVLQTTQTQKNGYGGGWLNETTDTPPPVASPRHRDEVDVTDACIPAVTTSTVVLVRTPRGERGDEEKAVDVVFERSPRLNENLTNRSFSKSTGDIIKSGGGVSLRRNTSFSKRNVDRSLSVTDVAKKSENHHTSSDEESSNNAVITKAISTSNLQRKRSFTKSTNPSFVGSIRDKFRSSLRKKTNEEKEKDKENKVSKKEDAKSTKKECELKKKEEQEREKKHEKKGTSINIKRASSSKTTITSTKNSSNEQKQPPGVSKITSNNEVRLTVTRGQPRSTKFGGSTVDIRNKSKLHNETEQTGVSKTLSNSATDIRSASYRATASSAKNQSVINRNEEVRGSFRTTSARTGVTRNASDYHGNEQEKSNFVRATGVRSSTAQNNDVRSSVRRGANPNDSVRSSVRKTHDNKPTVTKSTSIRATNSSNVIRASSTRNTSLTPRDNSTAKRTGVRRSNSRAGANNNHHNKVNNNNNSAASSAASTPNISRENSRTNMKIPVRRQTPRRETSNKTMPRQEASQEEKDILRIAKAFQRATNEIDAAKDKVEQFMINVVIDDIESCTNNRLNVDELYDHIRHQMIVSQNDIFDGFRSEILVDMSQYFELFFTALASHFNRVGCEITTDSSTQQRFCYLTHIKLIEHNNNDIHNNRDLEMLTVDDEIDDDMQASYV